MPPPSRAQLPEKETYAARRKTLLENLEDGIALLGNTEDDKNFYYLTGLDEANAVAVLSPGEQRKFVLFVRPVNPRFALWTGDLAGIEGAMREFGADTAYSLEELDRSLREFLRGKKRVYLPFNQNELRERVMNLLSFPRPGYPSEVVNLSPLIHEMRLFKDDHEIALMRKAIDITCEAQIAAMKFAHPGCREYEIEAVIEYTFRKNGSEQPGFPSIVGSGPNSTVLHYEKNDRRTENGDLVVMDIGAEYRCYTADVTRTMPVSGRFTPEQRDIYELVLKAQKEAVDMIRPGLGIQEIHHHACGIIAKGLTELGLMTDPESEWQRNLYLMYNISHWLGLDVHDVGEYRREDNIGRKLEPGMVLTVEPGIYISDNTLKLIPRREGIPRQEIDAFIRKVEPAIARYRNTGVRIEDDVLVTENGYENLSGAAPKEVREIEKLMKK